MKIGFIGTGVMGSAIVRHLLKAGHEVTVYNRTKAKAETLVKEGAVWADTPKLVADNSQVIFSMVGYPSDVEEIYYGNNGIFTTELAKKILVDLTTSTPTLAEKIAETAEKKGAKALDAPVSGGDLGAKNGTLTIMVGGEEAVYDQVLPLLHEFGTTITLHGSAGKGQHTKMANQ